MINGFRFPAAWMQSLRVQSLARLASFMIVICLLLFATIAQAQTDISVLLSTEAPSFNVGDRVALDLTVQHPAKFRVVPPDIVGTWGDLEVLDVVPLSVEANDVGSETTRLRLMVTAWEPGAYVTPPLLFDVGNDVGELVQVSAESINLTVVPLLSEQDLALRDLKPQAEIADLSPLLRRLVIAGVVALLIAVLAYAAYVRTRQVEEAIAAAPPVELRKPNVIAIQEIDAVESKNLPEAGLFNEHYTQITDALRRYLERTFNISAMEATTFEIRRDLRSESKIDAAQRQQLISMLQSADLVKFARAKPDFKAAKLLPGRARAFVRDSYNQAESAETTQTTTTTEVTQP